jgi:uncharacterized protein YdaU (DUF1376 family)
MARDDQPPYFPFYPDDFVSSGTVECMSTKSVGAHILLLCKAWRENPPASLPSSEPVLARWARVSAEEWEELRSEVLSAWTLDAGRYHNRRLRLEYDKFIRLKKERQQAGKHGAEMRWKNKPKMAELKQSHSSAMAEPWQAVASAVPGQNPGSPGGVDVSSGVGSSSKDGTIGRTQKPPSAPTEVRIQRPTNTPWQKAVDHIHAGFLARKGLPPEWTGKTLERLRVKAKRFEPEGLMAIWDEACRRLWHADRAAERDAWNAQRWRQDGHTVLFFLDVIAEYICEDDAWKTGRDSYRAKPAPSIIAMAKSSIRTSVESGK